MKLSCFHSDNLHPLYTKEVCSVIASAPFFVLFLFPVGFIKGVSVKIVLSLQHSKDLPEMTSSDTSCGLTVAACSSAQAYLAQVSG